MTDLNSIRSKDECCLHTTLAMSQDNSFEIWILPLLERENVLSIGNGRTFREFIALAESCRWKNTRVYQCRKTLRNGAPNMAQLNRSIEQDSATFFMEFLC